MNDSSPVIVSQGMTDIYVSVPSLRTAPLLSLSRLLFSLKWLYVIASRWWYNKYEKKKSRYSL